MRRRLQIDEYVNGILSQNRFILSQAITLVESQLENDNALGMAVIEKILPYTGKSIRIGITGVPGVGKSTFIEAFGGLITDLGKKLAVLAIDPSSQKTGGSIMGDKTRMEKLSINNLAYIRPSPSGTSLGGVSRRTRETMLLCEAAGFEVIFVETVGVGQSETSVASMTDFFLLLMLAGAGDELQGIKKGIMEMADLIAITKCDEGNEIKATQAKITYQNALMFFSAHEANWQPTVLTCSALQNKGLQDIWENVVLYQQKMKENGFWLHKRQNQNLAWMHNTIKHLLEDRFYHNTAIKDKLITLSKQVQNGEIHAVKAAYELVNDGI
jgi:LAO/AO transport system kinase